MPTKIPWSERTWNVSVGCTKVSAGCQNCYAEKMAYRLACMGQKKYQEVTQGHHWAGKSSRNGWNGKIYYDESALDKPLHWRKPCKIFVNSMSDLFHPGVPFEFIDKVLAVAALCPQHTFQILTKRADRMLEYFNAVLTDKVYCENAATPGDTKTKIQHEAYRIVHRRQETDKPNYNMWNGVWPLPNLIGMVTIENQEMADLRIPYLLKCGFKTTGVSVEPMLGPIDFGRIVTLKHPMLYEFTCGHKGRIDFIGDRFPERRGPGGAKDHNDPGWETCCGECGYDKVKMNLNWVIIGPENGPGKRPFKIEWARDLVAQCDAAGVPVFVKKNRHFEWPRDLRDRQAFPKGK